MEIPWQNEHVQMFGKVHVAPRLSCSIAQDGLVYRYKGSQGQTIPFTIELEDIRKQLAEDFQTGFNFVLANYYRNGNDYVGWHRDNERDLLHRGTIVSLSLGASRTFRFRDRTSHRTASMLLSHGDLLLMNGDCQERFDHTLARTRRAVGERVSLSFRRVLN